MVACRGRRGRNFRFGRNALDDPADPWLDVAHPRIDAERLSPRGQLGLERSPLRLDDS